MATIPGPTTKSQLPSVPPPPAFPDKASVAFKVSDFQKSGNNFLQQLSTMLSKVNISNNTLLATDLKLKSEEESMKELEKKWYEDQLAAEEAELAEEEQKVAVEQQQRRQDDNEAGPSTAVQPPDTNGNTATAAEQQRSKSAEDVDEQQPYGPPLSVYSYGIYTDLSNREAFEKTYVELAQIVQKQREASRQAASTKLKTLQNEFVVPSNYAPVAEEARVLELNVLAEALAVSLQSKSPRKAVRNHDDEAGLSTSQQQMAMAEQPRTPVPQGEVVLHIAVHVPHAPSRVSEEFLVLGSQPLTALRDILYCPTDENIAAVEKEWNNRLQSQGQPPAQLSNPSGYFYLEGTFYNDRRNAASIDYSAPIREYLASHGVAAPPHPIPSRQNVTTAEYSAAPMETTCFNDLWLKTGGGSPGLYCHEGCCEHLLVVKDVRLFSPGADPPAIEQYPFRLLVNSTLQYARQCECCASRTAKWVTYDDEFAAQTPFFWCDECYTAMHYDAEDKVLSPNFKVFPYTKEYYGKLLRNNLHI